MRKINNPPANRSQNEFEWRKEISITLLDRLSRVDWWHQRKIAHFKSNSVPLETFFSISIRMLKKIESEIQWSKNYRIHEKNVKKGQSHDYWKRSSRIRDVWHTFIQQWSLSKRAPKKRRNCYLVKVVWLCATQYHYIL